MTEHHEHAPKALRSPLLLRVVAVLILGVLAVAVGAFAAFAKLDGDKIVRGVKVAGQDVSLLSPTEATEELVARAEAQALTFSLNDQKLLLGSDELTGIASHNVAAAVQTAQAVGRNDSPTVALAARLRAAFMGVNVNVPNTLDRAALRTALEKHFSDQVIEAENAGFQVTFAGATPAVNVVEARPGTEVNYDAVMNAAIRRLAELSLEPIVIPTHRDQPELDASDIEPLTDEVVAGIARAPFTLTVKKETWTVSPTAFAEWVSAMRGEAGTPVLTLDRDKVALFLNEKAEAIRTEPRNAEFEEKDGEVIKFISGQNGESVDVDASLALIAAAAFGEDAELAKKPIELPLHAVEPDITTEEANPYGIKEIIGIGASNFRGSPANRRHNISVGANAVNGTLIAPDAEFSMIKTLGVIDGTTGYKQELVIKENRTTPEYGGGLCQIGSTAFRAALASGLPITMRKNHSYRVPYYERDGDGNYIGPGKDATIYDPLPDFRFKNDTGNYILIITAIEGNKVSFIFWGVKDGRVAEQTDARVYNIVPPPPKKIIQTTDIPVGTTKCTESAHVGSNAAFTYTVTMPGGEKIEKEFVSHYRPWQEVCLEGVDASALPPGVTSQEKVTPPPADPAAPADAPVAPPAAPAAPTTP